MKLLTLLLLSGGCLLAQTASGAITGLVKDSSDAAVPGATVTLTNLSTGTSAVAQSQGNGAYLFPNVLPGDYRIATESVGFKRLEIAGLKVNIGDTLTQDMTLEVGGVTETISVSSQGSLVQAASGNVGTTVQVSHVLEMPLVDRNVFRLVNLVPGAFSVGGNYSIGGGRTNSAAPMLDGINNSRGGLGVVSIELAPPVDSMQEFKVEVANLSAEFGRTAGGVVNAVTKSGTNQFHGSVYEFLRNDKLDASGWGNDAKPPLRRNNFGGTVGGPIIRNRTFFFYNYDGLQQKTGTTITRNVGLEEWRRGDFSRANRDAGGRAALVVIHDPETGTGGFASPLGTSPFPNNIIPAARLDPVALKAVGYLPSGNRQPNNPYNLAGNWQRNRTGVTTRNYHTTRVDHEWTDRTRVFGRYILTQPEGLRTPGFEEFGVADPDATRNPMRRQNLVVNLTHLFSPTSFLNITTGVNRIRVNPQAGDCCETNYGQLFGLANVFGESFPRFTFAGGLVPMTNLGPTNSANRIASFTNSEVFANYTRIHNGHTWKMGGQYSRYNGNDSNITTPSGSYTFTGLFTRGVAANGAVVANTGINMADFLLGRLNAVDARVSPTVGKRIQYYGAYFQDDWRVTPRLTINLGVRYETETPVHEVASRLSNFDPYTPNPLAGRGDIPAGAIGVSTFANRNGKGKYLWNQDKNNFAPRFGFAWRVFGTTDTVIRGGFGIYFGNPYDRETLPDARAGFDRLYSASHPLPYRLRDGLPAGALDSVPVSELLPTFGNRGTRFAASSVSFYDPERVNPYNENFNLTVQHQWKSVLFEVGWLGNLARHVPFPAMNLNHVPTELLSRTEIPVRLRRPWTPFASDQAQIQMLAPNWGISNYQALTLKSERRFREGYGWVVSYTFTKWIDNVGFKGVAGPTGDDATVGDNDLPQNIYNRRAERSLSVNGVPHRVVFSPVIELPFGKGKRWMNRAGIVNHIAGGWQASTLATLRAGAPFGVQVLNGGRDILGDQAIDKVLRPDLVGNPSLPNGQKGTPAQGVRGIQWLNPSAFALPARFTHGNAARTLPGVLGPGSVNFDTLLAKNFRVGERWHAQLRWEMFDAFNTPEFGLPNDLLGGNSFGIVTSAEGRRIMQFGLKLYW